MKTEPAAASEKRTESTEDADMNDVPKTEAEKPAAVETDWQKKWSEMNARVEKLEASTADWEGWWHKSADWEEDWEDDDDGDEDEPENHGTSSGSQSLKKKPRKTIKKAKA